MKVKINEEALEYESIVTGVLSDGTNVKVSLDYNGYAWVDPYGPIHDNLIYDKFLDIIESEINIYFSTMEFHKDMKFRLNKFNIVL